MSVHRACGLEREGHTPWTRLLHMWAYVRANANTKERERTNGHVRGKSETINRHDKRRLAKG